MHRMSGIVLSALLSTSMLAACQNGGGPNISNETIGTLGGAAGGAVIGKELGGGTAGTAIGAVLGALAGRELADRLDDDDEERAVAAERAAISRNEEVAWSNPDSGTRGTINPVRTYTNDDGNLCREYTHTVYINGRAETARGTACRQDDGTWRLVG